MDEKENEAEEPLEDAESLRAHLAEEREKAERYLNNWKRAQADLENYRRRAEQEMAETARRAADSIITALLPVIDDLERAMEHAPAQADPAWLDGIRGIHGKFLNLLRGLGVSPIEALGAEFDPNFHHAIMVGEGEENIVLEEWQRGYRRDDRVLRPSIVKVGKGG